MSDTERLDWLEAGTERDQNDRLEELCDHLDRAGGTLREAVDYLAEQANRGQDIDEDVDCETGLPNTIWS